MKVLVKVSGSLIRDKRFYDWLPPSISSFNRRFILCGGGDSITEALKERGIPYTFGLHGREISSLEGKLLAKQVLEEGREFVMQKLGEMGLHAVVLIPVNNITGEHKNGDEYALAISPKFDKVYLVTLKERDKSLLENPPRVEAVYL